jgi:hypothetical protein
MNTYTIQHSFLIPSFAFAVNKLYFYLSTNHHGRHFNLQKLKCMDYKAVQGHLLIFGCLVCTLTPF